MSVNRLQKTLPAWALPVAIGVGIVVLIFLGVRALTGTNTDVGPPTPVHAGMYDFRKEVQLGHVGHKQ